MTGSISLIQEAEADRHKGSGADENREPEGQMSMTPEPRSQQSDTSRGRSDLPSSIPPLREISPLGNESLWSHEARVEEASELS